MVLLLLLLSFFSIVITFLIPFKYIKLIKNFSLLFSIAIFSFALFLTLTFDKTSAHFQQAYHFIWSDYLNIYYSLGVDGFSVFFVLLTTFLIPFCILYSWNQFIYAIKELLILLLIIEFLLINFFLVTDLIFFFIFFESILIPMFLLIGCFGSRQRRIHASFQFFLFTMTGSFFMLLAFFIIYIHEGSTDFLVFYYANFSYEIEILLWFLLFFSLAVKVPLFPVHIWLPEAHVEAPTVGSVILAGVLLKMGSYGMLRFLLPIFHFANHFFNPLIFVLSFLSIYYVSVITFCQIDLKKLIAYSSVSHMGYVTVSIFTYDLQGVQGSIFLMLSHGIVSSLLFFLIGMLYDRYKTRTIFFFQSLYTYMPHFSLFFFVATLANVGFPGTISFVGEFLILVSFFLYNKMAFLFSSLAFIVSAAYSFWLFNRICGGMFVRDFKFGDLSRREFYTISPFIFLIFLLGLYPKLILGTTELSVLNILQEFDKAP
jgi:proton-translocating NADH-quinone oxidoreductase chain M